MTYKIPKEQIPCKFDHTYWEDVAGDGGSRMRMFDCRCDAEFTDEQLRIFENQEECSLKCPGYKPLPVGVCEKHGVSLKLDVTAFEKLAHIPELKPSFVTVKDVPTATISQNLASVEVKP